MKYSEKSFYLILENFSKASLRMVYSPEIYSFLCVIVILLLLYDYFFS